jgi:hypothetical protein
MSHDDHPYTGRLGPPDPPGWAESARLAKVLPVALAGTCVLLILADLLYHKHGHYDFEQWLGFHGFYGFVSFVFLVLVATQMRKLVMRGPHYYDPDDPDASDPGGH